MDWIGPTLSGVGGAFLLWLSQMTMKAWNDRQKARENRENREDLLFRTIRVLTDEVSKLRQLGREHGVSEDELGPLVITPWDRRNDKDHGE
jgi:hypothetical protein